MNFFDLQEFRIDLLEYRATDAICETVKRSTLDQLIATAEQARINRRVELSEHQMYMIRMFVPPSERMVAVLFLEDMKGVRRNVVAYYDEIEHIIKPSYESGDIKKFQGSPFDKKPQIAPEVSEPNS